MNIHIYQINSQRDTEHRKFFDLPEGKTVDPSIYDEVFSGEVDCKTFEDVYRKFNDDGHPLHRGHSLSVSDVVVMDGKAAICQSIGFQEVDFDQSAAHKPDDLLRILYVEPGKPAYEAEVGRDIRLLQKAVQGLIEFTQLDENTVVVSNEEFLLNGMEWNRLLPNGIAIAGPFFVAGQHGPETVSLTDEQVDKYMKVFAHPHEFGELAPGVGFVLMPM